MTQNDYLNNQILKKEWGFRGILMSDWDATYDGVAAANGGLDLEMPSGKFMNRETLLPAVKDGRVPLATIDDKVGRILRTTIGSGFFDRQQTNTDLPLYNQEDREVALDAARAGMVLLKNSGNVLPLDKTKVKTIAVIGPDAYPAVSGGGGSSLVQPFNTSSCLEGISNYLGTKARVLYAVDHPPFDEVWEGTQFLTAPDGENGLRGEYFNNEEMSGTPALVRTARHIDFHWAEGSYSDTGPMDHFSARWTGYYVPKTSGDYRFYVSGDDGYRLYLDDARVIDDWMRQGETLNAYTAYLEAGRPYKIRLEYFEAVGTATIDFGIIRAEVEIGRETREVAEKADVAIVCVGFDPKTEGEGADRTFRLPGGQDELIQQISHVNKNTIVVLTAGGNVDMRQWIDNVRGLLHVWYPGQEGGRALAQIIFGDYSPSGKLPASFERQWEDSATVTSYYPQNGEKFVAYKEGVFLGYRHFDRSSVKPLFPFGFGLSYATFAYSNLAISPPEGSLDQPITVSFKVKNTGGREGAEVAELYVGDSHASVRRPVKELKGFAKVALQPGETGRVTLTLDRRAFSYYDVKKKDWNAEPGAFAVLVGSSSAKIELQGTFHLSR
jgi:beta-glucosidase